MATLSIVGTPIGNMEDITLRALRILTEADVIFCEDTRVTKKLLKKHDITTPLQRLDAHTEQRGARTIIERIQSGKHIVYVTDAGTPAISDPGARLVALVRETCGDDVHIEAIPGPSAVIAALSVAGVSADTFTFLGFLPHKKGRQTKLRDLALISHTVVLFESPHRIEKLLGELAEHLSEGREVAVVREITKIYEEVRTGAPGVLRSYFAANPKARGEFVVIIKPLE